MTESGVLGFAAVSFAVVAVPGPSVLFAIGRAIADGRRSALLSVLGNASGLFVQVVLVALGLGVVVTGSDAAYAFLQLAGAAYLVWLGLDAIRRRHDAGQATIPAPPGATRSPLRDVFVVGVTNPKSVVFLAALLPQYVDLGSPMVAAQMVAFGMIFCLVAIVGDGAWAMLAARARLWLSSDPARLSRMSVAGGLVMIGLGLLLVVS